MADELLDTLGRTQELVAKYSDYDEVNLSCSCRSSDHAVRQIQQILQCNVDEQERQSLQLQGAERQCTDLKRKLAEAEQEVEGAFIQAMGWRAYAVGLSHSHSPYRQLC